MSLEGCVGQRTGGLGGQRQGPHLPCCLRSSSLLLGHPEESQV